MEHLQPGGAAGGQRSDGDPVESAGGKIIFKDHEAQKYSHRSNFLPSVSLMNRVCQVLSGLRRNQQRGENEGEADANNRLF